MVKIYINILTTINDNQFLIMHTIQHFRTVFKDDYVKIVIVFWLIFAINFAITIKFYRSLTIRCKIIQYD